MTYNPDEPKPIQFQDKQYFFHLGEAIEAKFKFCLLRCMIDPLI